jgi:hypothetical protein
VEPRAPPGGRGVVPRPGPALSGTVSYRDRDHGQGAVERGNDWLDGALAGWLLFIAISTSPYAWHAVRGGSLLPVIVYEAAAPLLALAAIFPLLRFLRIGWILAVACVVMMLVREGIALSDAPADWKAPAAFLVINLLALGYLLWIVPEFWPRHAEDDAAVPAAPPQTAAADDASPSSEAEATPERRAADAAPAGPTPVTQALAAIHQRIVAAGSACAVTPVSVRAEAGRFGVTPAALRTEGLALYRTFLQHFLADGPLSPDEERELICLERALDLDDDGVWRLRAEAGLVGGPGSPAPILSVLTEAMPDAIPDSADVLMDAERPPLAVPADEGLPAREEVAATSEDAHPPRAEPAPDRPAEAEAASYEPAAHSPDSFASTPSDADFLAETGVTGSVGSASGAPDGLADYEEHELSALLAWAGIPSLAPGTPRRVALERLRALHRTTTEPLEACASDQPLEPGESCLAIRTVELYRVPPGAASANAPADVPGPVLDPRSLVDGKPETDRDMTGFARTGVCRFVLTERRLLLVAPSGQNSPLPVSRVRAVLPFRNGLEVRPQRGSPVFLAFTGGVDDVAMRIDRAARDLRARA